MQKTIFESSFWYQGPIGIYFTLDFHVCLLRHLTLFHAVSPFQVQWLYIFLTLIRSPEWAKKSIRRVLLYLFLSKSKWLQNLELINLEKFLLMITKKLIILEPPDSQTQALIDLSSSLFLSLCTSITASPCKTTNHYCSVSDAFTLHKPHFHRALLVFNRNMDLSTARDSLQHSSALIQIRPPAHWPNHW